jgi:hypothetical protein
MNEQQWLLEPTFHRCVKVVGTGDRLTSEAGFLLLREADYRLGLTECLASPMRDPRQSGGARYTPVELLQQRLYVLYR